MFLSFYEFESGRLEVEGDRTVNTVKLNMKIVTLDRRVRIWGGRHLLESTDRRDLREEDSNSCRDILKLLL